MRMQLSPAIVMLALLGGACTHRTGSTTTQTGIGASVTAPSPANAQGAWRSLSDLSAWRGYSSNEVPAGWHAADGVISKESGTGDIMTRDQFANFELTLDWKIENGGNAGIFYRGTTEYDHIYWSAPEYQLLDDANAPDGKNRLTSAAAAYALYPPPAGVVKPAGEWNSTRIVVNGAHVEHWLNGQKVVEYELWSPDWKAKVAASKFKDYPNYGLATKGYIGIQGDHNGALSIRNIRIRELP
jgi:3-keto-disaccharide hydrolase